MGEYNPNIPHILGQEWVPIRDEDLVFDEGVNAFEQGHQFTLTSPRQVSDGRFYINQWPEGIAANQAYTMTVYAAGMEDSGGPVQRVVIPCNAASITGAGITIGSPSTTAVEALSNPGTGYSGGLRWESGNVLDELWAFFAVNNYAPLLFNKRILGVSFLLQYTKDPFANAYTVADDITPEITFDVGVATVPHPSIGGIVLNIFNFSPLAQGENDPPSNTRIFGRYRMGDVGFAYGIPSFPNTTTLNNNSVIPWTYNELQRFEATATNRLYTHIRSGAFAGVGPTILINYLALEVFYCEENRTLAGTRIFNSTLVNANRLPYNLGTNPIQLHDITTPAITTKTLPAGDYVVTVNQASMGDEIEAVSNVGPHADLNAVREIYAMPDQPGVRINLPFPLDETAVGREMVVETTHILPQLSLHTSGAGTALTEPHAYGRQVAAQVFGSVYAQQELFDTPVGSGQSYPWVRFYARRYGDTTVPLTLTGQSGLSTSSVSITPDEFDALTPTLGSWSEVTLRFDTAPTMGTLGTPTWRWTASGELPGNRWEILGACAPAISGTVGSYYTLAPAAQQLYNGTYYAPTGATQDLEWYPQGVGSAPISGVGVSDDSSDAFLIFAQDLPAISGFGVSVMSQAVSGIGQECDIDPCCIPNEIFYNRIVWTELSAEVQSSDFGYYQLQRMDTVETDWQTIMEATSLTGSAFNDFEARIGILTSYRMRAVDSYEFPGPWSDTVTATVPSPGIDGGECVLDGHVLVFTTNERQCGSSNLAYSSVWMEGRVQEDFAFPEAGFVQMQPMYNRDFFTAFRPLERGGEQFTRTVLVQAAAIDPETLADFRSLRDMAWESVNYICVRDEDGNRWFATIGVPSGTVLRNRRLYLAPVQIAEVTDVPTPVDAEFCEPPEPPPDFDCSELVCSDSFTRTESGDWGVADVGGAWQEA